MGSLLDRVLDQVEGNFARECEFLSATVRIPSVHLEVQDEERCQDLIAGHLGRPAPVTVLNAACDVWLYNRIAKTPTVMYGPGEVALTHGPDESVALDDLKAATRTMAALIVDWCG